MTCRRKKEQTWAGLGQPDAQRFKVAHITTVCVHKSAEKRWGRKARGGGDGKLRRTSKISVQWCSKGGVPHRIGSEPSMGGKLSVRFFSWTCLHRVGPWLRVWGACKICQIATLKRASLFVPGQAVSSCPPPPFFLLFFSCFYERSPLYSTCTLRWFGFLRGCGGPGVLSAPTGRVRLLVLRFGVLRWSHAKQSARTCLHKRHGSYACGPIGL